MSSILMLSEVPACNKFTFLLVTHKAIHFSSCTPKNNLALNFVILIVRGHFLAIAFSSNCCTSIKNACLRNT